MCLSLSPLLLKNTYQVELHLTFDGISLSGMTAERLCVNAVSLWDGADVGFNIRIGVGRHISKNSANYAIKPQHFGVFPSLHTASSVFLRLIYKIKCCWL